MNLIHRTGLYLRRKKIKNGILLVMLFVIGVLIISGMAILRSTDDSASSMRKTIGGSVHLSLDETNNSNWKYTQGIGGTSVEYIGTPVTDETIREIMQIEGITGYNAVGDGSIFAIDFNLIEGFTFGEGSNYTRIPSVTNSEKFNYFIRGAFALKEGRHIQESDNHVALISSELAEQNGLQLGDSIKVKCCYDVGEYPVVSLSIIGIYDYKGDSSGFNTTSTDKRNRIIIDHDAMQEIMQTDTREYTNGVDFFVEDPQNIGDLVAKIKKLNLDWNAFSLTENNDEYLAVAASLLSMEKLVRTMTVGIIILSIIIGSLAMQMFLKQRKKEIGILLSLGFTPKNILYQIILETFLIAIIAFPMSYFASGYVADGASLLLYDKVSENQPEIEIEYPDDGTEYLDITGKYIPYKTENLPRIENIQVRIMPLDLILLIIVGESILIVITVVISKKELTASPRSLLMNKK